LPVIAVPSAVRRRVLSPAGNVEHLPIAETLLGSIRLPEDPDAEASDPGGPRMGRRVLLGKACAGARSCRSGTGVPVSFRAREWRAGCIPASGAAG